MYHEEYDILIAQYLAGEISEEGHKKLMAWAENDPTRNAVLLQGRKVWEKTGEHTPHVQVDSDAAWKKLMTKIDTQPENVGSQVEGTHRVRTLKWWRAAAAILVLLGAGLWIISTQRVPKQEIVQKETQPAIENIQIATQNDEQKDIQLPDGSQIWLNENTTIAYQTPFDKRNVTLTGEAFFDIERMEERPFTISSDEATTVVLGTTFNVRAYPEESVIEVTVVTGKVSVAPTNGNPEILTRGKKGIVEKAQSIIITKTNNTSNSIAWKSKKLFFAKTPMAQVIQDLNRYFGADIEVSNPAILQCRFSGTKEYINPSVETILDEIAFMFTWKVEKKANTYTIVGEACE